MKYYFLDYYMYYIYHLNDYSFELYYNVNYFLSYNYFVEMKLN